MLPPEANRFGEFIPLHYHHHMLSDTARLSAFKAAIDQTVPIGGRVVELGSGTGVLSFFAAQRAKQVLAVEVNPQLVNASRRILVQNGFADRITLVQADAATFVPDAPVDVVICEMLHSALLQEKQLEILQGFKQRYQTRFGILPRFVPEATILAVQPLTQDYDYLGFQAPLPLFQDAASTHARSIERATPQGYACVDYSGVFADGFEEALSFQIQKSCTINAIRFITKNILCVLPTERRSIDWSNQLLVVPLRSCVEVKAGDTIKVRFAYRAGASIDSLSATLLCERVTL